MFDVPVHHMVLRVAGPDEIGSTGRQEGPVIRPGNEAHLLRIGLAGHREAQALGVRPGLPLRLPTHWEQRPGQLPLAQHVQDI